LTPGGAEEALEEFKIWLQKEKENFSSPLGMSVMYQSVLKLDSQDESKLSKGEIVHKHLLETMIALIDVELARLNPDFGRHMEWIRKQNEEIERQKLEGTTSE